MKKSIAILAVALFTAACVGTVGPMGPAGPKGEPGRDGVQKYIFDDIVVEPDDWQEALTEDNLFDYFYADMIVPGFTEDMLYDGLYDTYWKYDDNEILIQEGLGVSMHLERFDTGINDRVTYTETIGCSYSNGEIRFQLSRSDFYDEWPSATLVFRMVVIY